MSAQEAKKCQACGGTYESALSFCPNDGQRLVVVDTLIGQLLDGRYRIESLLGKGGIGVVYQATHIHIDTKFAVKILNPDLVANQSAIERFRREAKAAGRIHHPNAVQVTDFGVTAEKIVYLVMELVNGRSLRDLLCEKGTLDYRYAIGLIQQVCAAVEAAHESGIIHRDLKPDNIMIKEEGQAEVVKVLDFGIAKLKEQIPSSGARQTLTREGTIIGTPEYMSPEQCRGQKLDSRSDIYSIGVILYEILCGNPPFMADSPLEVVVKHLSAKTRPLCEMCPTVPEPIERIVMRALEKDPAQRPASAAKLSYELQEALKAVRSGYTTGFMDAPLAAEFFPGADPAAGRGPALGEDQTQLSGAETSIDSAAEPFPSPNSIIPAPPRQRPTPSDRRTVVTPSGTGMRVAPESGGPTPTGQPQTIPTPPQPLLGAAKVAFVARLTKSRILIPALAAILLLSVGVIIFSIWGSKGGEGLKPSLSKEEKPSPKAPPNMVLIRGGAFMMGREDDDPDERPVHQETVKDFYLDKYEVTNEEYKKFVDAAHHDAPPYWANGTYPDGQKRFPVTQVTWYDADQYANWAGKRLPSEKEWEYAARNGSKQDFYPWGKEWKEGMAAVQLASRKEPMPVDYFEDDKNEFGVYGLAGNVSEWVQDSSGYYDGRPAIPPCYKDCKIFRGGNFRTRPEKSTATYRYYDFPDHPSGKTLQTTGFRCAKDVGEQSNKTGTGAK